MNIKNAWLALIGKLPVERVVERVVEKERLVHGDETVLYEARSRTSLLSQAFGVYTAKPDWHGTLYRTCAEAFAAHGAEADVVPCMAIIDGNKAYVFTGLEERTLAPKPKVAKGKRGARG